MVDSYLLNTRHSNWEETLTVDAFIKSLRLCENGVARMIWVIPDGKHGFTFLGRPLQLLFKFHKHI